MSAVAQPEPLLLRFPVVPGAEIRLRPGLDIAAREGFARFCADNPDLRIERNARGELTIEMPTKGLTGARNALLAMALGVWALTNGEGLPFDSRAGFELPDGATLSPDASWIPRDRLAELTAEQKESFLPLAPDFVIELRSETDRLTALQAKLGQWHDNGVRLGLLVDPQERRVHIYRSGADPLLLDNPTSVDCSPELPGFVLDVKAIFDLTL